WLMMARNVTVQIAHPFLLIAVALLSSWLFAAFGMVIGTFTEPQHIALIFQVVMTPMIFFGCAYYPWATLRVVPWFQKFVLINPLVYASEAFRAALTAQLPPMPPCLIFAALVTSCVPF